MLTLPVNGDRLVIIMVVVYQSFKKCQTQTGLSPIRFFLKNSLASHDQ